MTKCHHRPPAALRMTPIAIRPHSSAAVYCLTSSVTVSLHLRCTLARICLVFFFMYVSTRLLY